VGVFADKLEVRKPASLLEYSLAKSQSLYTFHGFWFYWVNCEDWAALLEKTPDEMANAASFTTIFAYRICLSLTCFSYHVLHLCLAVPFFLTLLCICYSRICGKPAHDILLISLDIASAWKMRGHVCKEAGDRATTPPPCWKYY
jgi:hypothetical protein